MEKLKCFFDSIRIPEPDVRIHTKKCCVSSDTPKSPGGLYVDMYTFLAFGKDYVDWNYTKTKHRAYLHIKETQKSISEGGSSNNNPEYERNYGLFILPEQITIPLPSETLPETVKLAIGFVIRSAECNYEDAVRTDDDEKFICEHAMDLKQLDNRVMIPPSDWKCEMCNKKDNLWLNLTDGSIHCGPSICSSACALSHYNMTNYPLFVKLETITADTEAAEVFCHDEGSVLDPLLAQHLQHFGIDNSSLDKIEPATVEKELIQDTNFDPKCIKEGVENVQLLSGKGYTGIINPGNRKKEKMFDKKLESRAIEGYSPSATLRRFFNRMGYRELFYGALTPVKNQGERPCCVTIVFCDLVSAYLSIKCEFLVIYALSYQELIDKIPYSEEQGGVRPNDCIEYLKTVGVSLTSAYPIQNLRKCSTRTPDFKGLRAFIEDFVILERPIFEDVCDHLAHKGPLFAIIYKYQGFSNFHGSSLFENRRHTRVAGPKHVVFVEWFDKTTRSLVVKNSHGVDFGKEGFAKIEYACFIQECFGYPVNPSLQLNSGYEWTDAIHRPGPENTAQYDSGAERRNAQMPRPASTPQVGTSCAAPPQITTETRKIVECSICNEKGHTDDVCEIEKALEASKYDTGDERRNAQMQRPAQLGTSSAAPPGIYDKGKKKVFEPP